MMTRLPPLLLLCLALSPSPVLGQEKGQTGIAMGYPTNIAFIWHASDSLAIRPELNLVRSSSDTETTIFGITPTSNDTWNITVGASALWYMAKTESVRTYFSPRLTYGRTSSDSSSNSGDPAITTNVGVSASFGAQYAPVKKFSVFGELGYGVTRGSGKFETPISTTKSTGWNWAPRTAVGVIFYFGS
jgi:hypothetical protein